MQHAQFDLLSLEEYRQFGVPHDLQILEAAQDLWLNVLHIHGKQIMFDLFESYPVAVINWHDQETAPGLAEAQQRFPGAVCGGLRRWDTLVLGAPDQVQMEARAAMEETGGRRFVLGTGCVTPITAPHGNILAARSVVEV